MKDDSIHVQIRDVLRAATTVLSAREIAAQLPHINADSVGKRVSVLAKDKLIVRHHVADGILRYSLPEKALGAKDATPVQIARTYAAPVAAAAVRVAASAHEPSAGVDATPPAEPPNPQQRLRMVIVSQLSRRWNLSDIRAELVHRWPNAEPAVRKGAQPSGDWVPSRLGNLIRGDSAAVVRMPTDGTWMAGTWANKALAQRESQDLHERATRERAIDRERANACPAAEATDPIVDRGEGKPASSVAWQAAVQRMVDARARGTSKIDVRVDVRTEFAEHPERTALRALIAAVVGHIATPPAAVVSALRSGMDTLGTRAA